MIGFATDHYFHIGGSHLTGGKPCQDYALSGINSGAAHALVADGCSTGGLTDVGARVLALATAQAIRDLEGEKSPREIGARQQAAIAITCKTLGLSQQDMLATCIYAYMAPKGGFVHLQGDGVIAWKLQNGRIQMRRYEWEDNTPLYPAYAGDTYQTFIRSHGGDINAKRFVCHNLAYDPTNGFGEPEISGIALGEGIRGVTIDFTTAMLDELEFIAVFTDGVTQIDNVDWKDAVLELLNFKTTQGEFAKRRMIRAIKDFQKLGKGPVDDIAYSVIHVIFGKEE